MSTCFLPAGRTVEYTIEQKSTVPPETWHQFVIAVINLYYLLPHCLRPVSPRINAGQRQGGAYRLFKPHLNDERDELVFCGLTGEGYRHHIITVSRERSRDVLSLEVIETEHHMSMDMFTRLVMIALYNVCGEHFLVHSTAGACSWALPMVLLTSSPLAEHFEGWEAPEPAMYASGFPADNARLTEQAMVSSLLLAHGHHIELAPEQWEAIAALEFRLYEPRQPLSRQEVAHLTDPSAILVDITLGTSRGNHTLVTLRDFDALLNWVSINIPAYEEGVPDLEPVFLTRNHLAVLRDDIRNGRLATFNDNPAYGESFYAELQLVALWAEHCIRTLDFDRDSAFLFAVW